MRSLLVAVAALVVAMASVPAAASVDDHTDAWSTLSGSGELTQSCPGSGEGTVAGYEIGDGVLSVVGRDGEVLSQHALPGSGAWGVHERYELAAVGAGERGVERVVVTEGDTLRLAVLVDAASSVPVTITSYGGDGEVHCTFAFVDWSGGSEERPAEPIAAEHEALPTSVHGFVLGATVEGDGFTAGLYGDGVFTFSLTRWDQAFTVDGAGEGGPFQAADVGPGRSLLAWPVVGGTMVMIGDLPTDVRDAVVADLPEPDVPNLFRRLWRRLFG